MVKFLAVGDLHLEKLDQVLSGLDDIKLQLQCLRDASEYALKHSITRVVLLGDIFDTPTPKQKTVRQLLEVLNEYPRLEYHLIRGNHDVSNAYDNSLEIIEFIAELRALTHVNLYLSPVQREWDGIPVCFLSYPYIKSPKTKKPKIVFAHTDIAGALRDNGRKITKDEAPSVKIQNGDYWILGHLHRHQQKKNYLVVGTMSQMNFGEPLPKGFAVVTARLVDGQLVVKPKQIKYRPPFKLINLVVSDPKDLEKIKNKSTRRYKVILTDGVELPIGWRNQYPNVIKVAGAKGAKQLDQELAGQIPLTEQSVNAIDITRNLNGFLKQRGFSREQRRHGKELVHRILYGAK